MKKNTKFFIGEAAIETGNYILHYFFENQNFSGNRYIYNNTEYIDYTGNFIGNLNIVQNNLNFNGASRLDINLKNFSAERFCFILNYEKNNNNPCVLFSNLNTGISGEYYGFNVCINNYNNILIEYYDTGKQLDYIVGDINLDTKGVIALIGHSNYIKVNYYNPASDNVVSEEFIIDNNLTPNVTGSIILGSGKFSQFPNYSGGIKDFIFIDNDIGINQLNVIVDQFFYNLNSSYSFVFNSENYSYLNYPDDSSNTFDSYIDTTGCFSGYGDDFLENTGIIYGSITGINYSLDLTGISGKGAPIISNFESLKNNIQKLQIFGAYAQAADNTKAVMVLLKDGTLTGWGDNIYGRISGSTGNFNNWTGTPVGQLTNIVDFDCKRFGCLALLDDGTATGWGINNFGNIFGTTGNNNLDNIFTGIFSDSPLGQLNNISGISKGFNSSIFLRNDGTLISWGANSDGQVAGINDRKLGFPLKLKITGIYDNYSYLNDLILDYTGFINNKPSYQYINDFQNFGLRLYNNNTGWILDYSGLSDQINITGNTYTPLVDNDLNIPYQIQVNNSLDTGINVLYTYDPTSGYINDINNWRIFYSGSKWIVYSGITGYENSLTNSNVLPLSNWTGIETNNYFGSIDIFPKYLRLDYVYNTDNNGLFTGIFEDTIVSKLTGISKISAGYNQIFALKNDGKITGWGFNLYKNVDPNNTSEIWSGNWNNNILNSLTGIIDIQSVSDHTIVLFNDGKISGWGSNYYENLLPATGGNNLTGVIEIRGGDLFSQALLLDNKLTGWGLTSSYPFFSIVNSVKNFDCGENGSYVEYISGQNIKNIVTGTLNYLFNITVERPIVINETITTIVSQISGFENQILFSGVTGYTTGWMKDIPTFCGTGFPLYLISGLTGIITGDVLTGVDIITSSFNQQRIVLQNQTYQTGFSSGISNVSKTGNYIYEFLFEHDGGSIDGTEILYLDKYNYTNQSKLELNKDEALRTNRFSNIRYTKNYSLDRNLNIVDSYGVDDLIIQEKLDQDDIIEVYLFKSDKNINTILDEQLKISRASSNFRFVSTGLNYIVNSNGVVQIFQKDYTLIDTNLASPTNLNYDFGDYLDGDFLKTGDIKLDYTGQSSETFTPKDFVYLNGVKLVSGYHYNFNNNNINFTNNISVTGLIYAFNSLLPYTRYTGYSNFYDLPRFNKNTTLIWLNGIKLNPDSYYEISQNDQYYTPDFYDKTNNIIYNNTDTFINE